MSDEPKPLYGDNVQDMPPVAQGEIQPKPKKVKQAISKDQNKPLIGKFGQGITDPFTIGDVVTKEHENQVQNQFLNDVHNTVNKVKDLIQNSQTPESKTGGLEFSTGERTSLLSKVDDLVSALPNVTKIDNEYTQKYDTQVKTELDKQITGMKNLYSIKYGHEPSEYDLTHSNDKGLDFNPVTDLKIKETNLINVLSDVQKDLSIPKPKYWENIGSDNFYHGLSNDLFYSIGNAFGIGEDRMNWSLSKTRTIQSLVDELKTHGSDLVSNIDDNSVDVLKSAYINHQLLPERPLVLKVLKELTGMAAQLPLSLSGLRLFGLTGEALSELTSKQLISRIIGSTPMVTPSMFGEMLTAVDQGKDITDISKNLFKIATSSIINTAAFVGFEPLTKIIDNKFFTKPLGNVVTSVSDKINFNLSKLRSPLLTAPLVGLTTGTLQKMLFNPEHAFDPEDMLVSSLSMMVLGLHNGLIEGYQSAKMVNEVSRPLDELKSLNINLTDSQQRILKNLEYIKGNKNINNDELFKFTGKVTKFLDENKPLLTEQIRNSDNLKSYLYSLDNKELQTIKELVNVKGNNIDELANKLAGIHDFQNHLDLVKQSVDLIREEYNNNPEVRGYLEQHINENIDVKNEFAQEVHPAFNEFTQVNDLINNIKSGKTVFTPEELQLYKNNSNLIEQSLQGIDFSIRQPNYWKDKITRNVLKSNPDKVFIFGDNLIQRGLGGQAKEMRGEPNAYGVPTKKLPSMSESSFFTDKEFEQNKIAIDNAISKIPKNKEIIIPPAGIGTGLADLPNRAPKTYTYLKQELDKLQLQPISRIENTKDLLFKVHTSPFYGELSDKLAKLIPVEHITNISNLENNISGFYNNTTDELHINSNLHGEYFQRTLLHETLHKVINGSLTTENPTPQQKEFKDNIDLLFNEARSKIALTDGERHGMSKEVLGHALSNTKEFVAQAMSEFQFQQLLNDVNSDLPLNKKSLWTKFIDALKRLLSLNNENSILERVISNTTNYIDSLINDLKIAKQTEKVNNTSDVKTKPSDNQFIQDETLNYEGIPGEEEHKQEQLKEDIKNVSQPVTVLTQQLVNANGDRLFGTYNEMWTFGKNANYDEFVQGLFNRGLTQELKDSKDAEWINRNGYSWLENLYHIVQSHDKQTIAIVYPDHIELRSEGAFYDENNIEKSIIREKRMYQTIQEDLKLNGFETTLYEVMGFWGSDSKTVKNKFSNVMYDYKGSRAWITEGKDEAGKDLINMRQTKLNYYIRNAIMNGYVPLMSSNTHLMLDLKSLIINGENLNLNYKQLQNIQPWNLFRLIADDPDLKWKADPLLKKAVETQLSQAEKDVFNQHWSKEYLPKEVWSDLNNKVLESVFTYVQSEYLKRTLQGVKLDVQYFKRIDNVGGKGSTALMTDNFKQSMPTSEHNSFMWVDGNSLQVRHILLDMDTHEEAKKQFGDEFNLGDGAVFELSDVYDAMNEINFVDYNKRGIGRKSKYYTIGELQKSMSFKITHDTHPELYNFMVRNNIGRVVTNTAMKLKSKLRDEKGLTDDNLGQAFVTWNDIYGKKDAEFYKNPQNFTFNRDMMKDAHLISKGEVSKTARGVFPTWLRGGLLAVLPKAQREFVIDVLLKDIDDYQSYVNNLTDDKKLDELKKIADSSDKQNYLTSTMEVLRNLDGSKSNITQLQEFYDLFSDSVLKEKLQDALNHAQDGSVPILIPDLGNYRKYLVNSKQISEEQAQTYFYDNGFLKPGFVIPDELTFKRHKYDNDNRAFLFVNPPSGQQDGRALIVIGHIPGENGFIMNNEQSQIISGKDFDADVAFLVPVKNDNDLSKIHKYITDLDGDKLYKKWQREWNSKTKSKAINDLIYSERDETGKVVKLYSNMTKDEQSRFIGLNEEDANLFASNDNPNLFQPTNFQGININNYKDNLKMYETMQNEPIGRLYNIAVFYSEMVQLDKPVEYNGKQVSIDKSKIPFNMMLLNVLTHRIIDRMNDLKFLTFNYDSEQLLKHLFVSELSNEDLGNFFKQTLKPSLDLVKWKPEDNENSFYDLNEKIQIGANSSTNFPDSVLNKSAVKANNITYDKLFLTDEQQLQVATNLYNLIVGSEKNEKVLTLAYQNTQLSKLANILSITAMIGNVPSRVTSRLSNLRNWTMIDDVGRIEFLRSNSPKMYRDFIGRFLGGNRYKLKPTFQNIIFDSVNGRTIEIRQGVTDGKNTGILQYVIKYKGQVLKVHKSLSDLQKFDPNEFNALINKDIFVKKLFSPLSFDMSKEASKKFVRQFLVDAIQKSTNDPWFSAHSDEEKNTFYISLLGYLDPGKDSQIWGITSTKNLKSFKEENTKTGKLEPKRQASVSDALRLILHVNDPSAREFFNDYTSKLSNEISNVQGNIDYSIKDSIDIFPKTHTNQAEYDKLVNKIITKDFPLAISDERVARMWNILYPDKQIVPNQVTREHRIEWLNNLIEEQFGFATTIKSANAKHGAKYNVFSEIYKAFDKMGGLNISSDIKTINDLTLGWLGKNKVWQRAIRFLSNRNIYYPANEEITKWFANGESHTANGMQVTRNINLKYIANTPVFVSGAMIDLYVRLNTFYNYGATGDYFGKLIENLGVINDAPSLFPDLSPSQGVLKIQSKQEESWNIHEGLTNILRPDEFQIGTDGKFIYKGIEHEIFYKFEQSNTGDARTEFELDLLKQSKKPIPFSAQTRKNDEALYNLAKQVLEGKLNKPTKFENDLIIRQTMNAMLTRYYLDYIPTKVIDTQIEDLVKYFDELKKYNNLSSEVLGMISSAVHKLQEMKAQIEGMKRESLQKGMYYSPHTFHDYDTMEDGFVKYFTKLGVKDAKKRAKDEINKRKKEVSSTFGDIVPTHDAFYHRIYDVPGYVKNTESIHKYLKSFTKMLRDQMLQIQEVANRRFLKDETSFMKNQINQMAAISLGKDKYLEYTTFNKLKARQFISFEIKTGKNQQGDILYKTISGEIQKVNNDTIFIDNYRFGEPGQQKFLLYKKANVSNLRTIVGLRVGKKVELTMHQLFGWNPIDITTSGAVKFVDWVTKSAMKFGSYSMLAFKFTYSVRNLWGAKLNERAIFGTEDMKNAQNLVERYTKLYKDAKIKSGFNPETRKYLDIIQDKGSVFMGGVAEFLGRFNGVIQVTQDYLSPEMLESWSQRKRSIEVYIDKVKDIKLKISGSPEDIGLKEEMANTVSRFLKEKYMQLGLYNIFGFMKHWFPKIEHFTNPQVVEEDVRDETPIIAVHKLIELFANQKLTDKEQKEAAKFVIANMMSDFNDTQKQYLPGFFQSRLASTMPLTKQFSYYSATQQATMWSLMENAIIQLKQFGLVKNMFNPSQVLSAVFPTKSNWIHYTVGNVEYADRNAADQSVRWPAHAFFTGMLKRMSTATKRLILFKIGAGVLGSIFELTILNTMSDSVSVAGIEFVLNWALHVIGSSLDLSLNPVKDTDWDKKWKRAVQELLGYNLNEFEQAQFDRATNQIPNDYIYGTDSDSDGGLKRETIDNEYWRKWVKDYGVSMYSTGVGESQIIDALSDLYITAYAPDNVRETLLSFAQTKVPGSYVALQFARSLAGFEKTFKIGYNPIQTRINELAYKKQQVLEEQKKDPLYAVKHSTVLTQKQKKDFEAFYNKDIKQYLIKKSNDYDVKKFGDKLQNVQNSVVQSILHNLAETNPDWKSKINDPKSVASVKLILNEVHQKLFTGMMSTSYLGKFRSKVNQLTKLGIPLTSNKQQEVIQELDNTPESVETDEN